jgi:hypothetical protein
MLHCSESIAIFCNFSKWSINMPTEFCTRLNDIAFQTLNNWKKIGETNIRIAEKLFNAQIELASSLLDVVTLNGEEISQTKDVKEIASLQAEIVQVSGKLIFENAQSTANILAEAGKVYSHLCETSLKSGAEFATPANAPKAKKAA